MFGKPDVIWYWSLIFRSLSAFVLPTGMELRLARASCSHGPWKEGFLILSSGSPDLPKSPNLWGYLRSILKEGLNSVLAVGQMWPGRSSHGCILPGDGVLLLCPVLCPKNALSPGVRGAGKSILYMCLSVPWGLSPAWNSPALLLRFKPFWDARPQRPSLLCRVWGHF